MSFFSELKQNITESSGNTSTANLGASATFTGTGVSTSGAMGIMVSLKTDQNCTVFIDQSPDNSNWDIVDTFNYHQAHGGESFNVMTSSMFMRVRVTNLNTVTATTYFRLMTMLAPIMDPLPRSLDSEGNLVVSVDQLRGGFSLSAIVDQSRGLKTVQPTHLCGSTFYNTLEPLLWTTSFAGTGSVVVSNGLATLATGITSASNAKVYSFRPARFIFGSVNYVRQVIFVPAVTGINTRKWGAINANNGFFFQQDSVLGFGVGTRKGGVDTVVSTGSFVGDVGSTYILNTNMHSFEIYYLVSGAYFFIDGQMIHAIIPSSTSLVNNMDVTVGIENINGANINNNTLLVLGASIFRLGEPFGVPRATNINTNTTTVIKSGAGNLQELIINQFGGASSLTTIYDNTSATGLIIGVVKTGTASNTPFALDYKGVQFNIGLTIVTAGGAAPDLTFLWE